VLGNLNPAGLTLAWSQITSTPTTIVGYGLTDAANISFTNVTGTLPIVNGGTNATTANAALNNLLPSQTGNNSKVLSTNGTGTYWSTVGRPSLNTLYLKNTLSSVCTNPYDVVEDTNLGYFYVSCETSPATIIRVYKSTFLIKDSVTLNSGENTGIHLAIDNVHNVLYVTLDTSPAKIAKINTTSWAEIGSALTLASGENGGGGITIDPSGTYVYVGTILSGAGNVGPDYIVQIATSSFTVVNTLTGDLAGTGGAVTNDRGFYILTADFAGGYLYVGEDSTHTQIMKVNIPALTKVITLPVSTADQGVG